MYNRFTILSMLDSRALCAMAAVDRSFNQLTNAETEVWRSRAHDDPAINISARLNLTRSATPREDYLACLQRHALAKQGYDAEIIRQLHDYTNQQIGLTHRLTFHLLHESIFIVMIPLLLLLPVIFLAVDLTIWAVFAPLWLLALIFLWAALSMASYRRNGYEASRSICQAIMEQTTMRIIPVIILTCIAIAAMLFINLGAAGVIDWPLSARLSPTFALAALFALQLLIRASW
jgi:hypothetical protein